MNENLTTLSAPTFDELIKTELQKYDAIVPKVQELKDLFMNLEIQSIEDKEGYAKVKEGLKFMIGKRNEIEDKRKELKADSLKFGKAVDERAKEIQGMISPIEDYLRGEKEKIDQEVKAIKEAEEKEAKRKFQLRIDRLVLMNFKPFSDDYVWTSTLNAVDQHSLNKLNIEVWADDKFDSWCEDFYNDVIAKEEETLKIARIKEEQEKAELLAQQAILKEEQDRLKKEQEDMIKEVQAHAKERLDFRISILEELGLVVSQISPFIFYKNKSIISIDELKLILVSDWSATLDNIKKVISEIDESIRINEEIGRRNAELLAKAKLEKEQEDAKLAEIERLSLLGDADKYEHYIQSLLSIESPIMKSSKYKKEIISILDFLKSKKS